MIKKWFQNKKKMKLFKDEYSKELIEQDILNFDHKKAELELMEKHELIPSDAQNIAKEVRVQSVIRVIKEALGDNVLTREEIDKINKAFNSLELTHEDLPKKVIDELSENYLYYSIENSPLDELVQNDINITLPKTERCYLQQNNLKWVEQRSVTKRVNYGGITARVKIAKGIYYSAGSISPSVQKENIWKVIDAGDFYLTNKRIILTGNKTRNIRLNKILNMEVFKDGLLITKDAGNPVLLQGGLNFYALYLLLYRLMNDAA